MGSSSPNFKWSIDVFLSFRGKDTRYNFTSYLDMALRQKGVNVFIDDKLPRGTQISPSLSRSIEEALMSVVVFSENYASSHWCLDELVKIIECNESKGHIVLPVFYKVEPSDVRKQKGNFGEALAKHQSKFTTIKIQTWRDALTAAANWTGWVVGYYWSKEVDLIQEIVERILWILNHTYTPLYVAKYPVGIDSQLNLLNSYSQYQTQDLSSGAHMVGIYGLGGIGKTTLAKALYNKITNQFEGSCFLSNVKEASKQFNGLVQLQEYLLYEILKEDLKVGNLDKGINIIRNRLRTKKVLIVLDDVDKFDQLEALVGGRDWFGSGSKIIVTTRNNYLLSSHEIDEKYDIRGLEHDNALELFSWHAFKKNHPSSNFEDLSKRATIYCRGLPLALVILGSFLYGRDRAKWESILDEFENSLHKDIRDILQISYDGLEDKVKDIFLDISCLFMEEGVDYVKNMLNACHHHLDFGMMVLEDLSLITIEKDKIQMHDLIRRMGYEIVNGESSEPGKRSRLWLEQDILEVFIKNSGTDEVKAIKLDLPKPTRLHMDAKAFRNMNNLRLLVVRNATFSTKLEHLPDNLKWIEWHGFAHPSLPSCFMKKNLIGLDLQHSFIKSLGKGFKGCKMLRHVDLTYSTLLEKIPEFSTPSNVQELFFRNCSSLRKIPASIVSLGNLVTLDLAHCSNLKRLPNDLRLKFLKVLKLSYCKRLKKLPDFSTASNLEELYLKECTNLRMIHDSIGCLNKLVILDLGKCSNLEKLPSYLNWKSLEHLYLTHCEKLEEIPDFSLALNLKSLCLEKCTNLRMIHESIGSLNELVSLNLKHCYKLETFVSYLRLKSLFILELSGCRKLEKFPKISENMKSLTYLHLSCTAIKELPSSIGYLTKLTLLNLEGCTNLISLPNTIFSLKKLEQLCVRRCSKFDATIQQLCSSSKIMETLRTSELPHLLFPKDSLYSRFKCLDLQYCNISNVDFLESLCNVSPFLSDLLLSENKFISIPPCLHKFTSLWNLRLRNCKFLQEIPNLPQCIQKMDATGCESLAKSPGNIVDIISNKQDISLGDFPREFILMNFGIPEWFSYRTISNSIRVNFRHDLDTKRILATYVTFNLDGDSHKDQEALVSCSILISNRLQSSFMRKFPSSTSEYTWLIATSSPTFSNSLAMNDWNHVTVLFEVIKSHEVTVTIRSCGVHLTEEAHGIQNDVRRPEVIYSDFDQPEGLPSMEAVKYFAQEVSAKSDGNNAMLHAENYPKKNNPKLQNMNHFPIHVTSHGVTRIRGMEGMAETKLFKSICNKFLPANNALNRPNQQYGYSIPRLPKWERQQMHMREALNSSRGFVTLGKYGLMQYGMSTVRLSSQKYLRIFDDRDRYGDFNQVAHESGENYSSRIARVDLMKARNFND